VYSLTWRGLAFVAVLGAGAALWWARPARTEDKPAPDRAALERTRETVRMLDDLYKGAVVHITDTYVRAREKTPAARVAKKIFKHMEEKGWHRARLVDATGKPENPANAPMTEFEKRAVEKLKKGATWFEEVGRKGDRTVLRAATPVPVVMKACINCHPGKKEGDLLGAIVYEIPVR
jgi:Protein of unknown function (DUF3365)